MDEFKSIIQSLQEHVVTELAAFAFEGWWPMHVIINMHANYCYYLSLFMSSAAPDTAKAVIPLLSAFKVFIG